jgi:hypothetical protein
MENTKIPLTKSQKELLTEFYDIAPTKVVIDKEGRNIIWNSFKEHKRCSAIKANHYCENVF